MAKKRSTAAVEEQENEETASESASSSEAEGEEEEVSSDKEEQQNPPSSQLSSKTTPSPNSNPKNNSEEDEHEEETDSDNEPPPKTKSLEQTLKSKPQPKPSPAPARSGTKRPAENNDTKQSNKKKTTAEEKKKEKEPEEDNKKSGDDSKKFFQRLFTVDDDVAILQGLVDFTEKTGTDPCKYPTAFYEFVKKSIHVQVKLDQLKNKVRKLKGKFERRIKSGKTPTNLKPVDEKIFELSKKVWGGKVNVNEAEENRKEPATKKVRTTKKLVMEPDSSLVVSKETRMVESGDGKEDLGLNETVCGEPFVDVMKRGMELIEESKRGELERRSKELQIAELELYVQRSELVKDSASLILDALKSSSSH